MNKFAVRLLLTAAVVWISGRSNESRVWANEDYARVKAILTDRCFPCHGALKQSGGLRLDTGAAMHRGGDSGPAVVAGKSDDSLLVSVITGAAGFRMPPENEGTALSADEIRLIRKWIDGGATSPSDEKPQEDPRSYWSYQPVRRPSLPTATASPTWSANAIDSFVSAKRHEMGLTASPDAEKAILLRRLYIDLIGLPPTPEELDDFLQDDRPDGLHRVTDRLLASPLYGQRWGRHWMDVWRYSDWYGSRGGNEIRYSQRHIWRWRDWIVESLNQDVGYDQMLMAMLAGDELAPGDPDVVRATGFLGRNWYKFDRNVWMFDTVEQTCQAFLGLTMKCARCHDHKFDPIAHRDYFRFRAFFEPHDVRTDPISGDLSTEKDATLGQVLKVGVAYVYDKQLDVPTYLFARGDSRSPVKDEPLSPGVPAALGGETLQIEPVKLPAAVVAPYVRDEVVVGMRKQAAESVTKEQQNHQAAEATVALLAQRLSQLDANATEPAPTVTPYFQDDFAKPRPDVWRIVNGKWEYEGGHLVQKQPGNFDTILANVKLPTDFAMRLRYRPLKDGQLHSVGIFFDVSDLKDCQAIYTAKATEKATVQAFHRASGAEQYPATGIFPCEFNLDELLCMDVAVRGQQLNVWLNGKLKLAYTMPTPRREGSVALWTHSATAEFHELRVDPLPPDFVLANRVEENTASPLEPPTRESLEKSLEVAKSAVGLAARKIETAKAEVESLEARIAAERAKAHGDSNANMLAQTASKAERQVALLRAEQEVLAAESALNTVKQPAYITEEMKKKEVAAAEAKVATAKQALEKARAELSKEDTQYTALGPTYPNQSTGRRLALARWIADAENPRTSRVAVNHIWLRHFGEGLVKSVANFGLNGQKPTHPELLDWLAMEFSDNQWSMKQLHRQMVTSRLYRMTSADAGADEQSLAVDPQNKWYWRMNSRRAESEVVRDSTLYLAGELDLTFGGPEIPESTGMESRRRSLYFRSTPNERMVFLELFDQANPNECYRRQESIVPQQSLALFNSSLSLEMARRIAKSLVAEAPLDDDASRRAKWVELAFRRLLCRLPTEQESQACLRFLERHTRIVASQPSDAFPSANGGVVAAASTPLHRAAENLVHVLLNHNDFVTVR